MKITVTTHTHRWTDADSANYGIESAIYSNESTAEFDSDDGWYSDQTPEVFIREIAERIAHDGCDELSNTDIAGFRTRDWFTGTYDGPEYIEQTSCHLGGDVTDELARAIARKFDQPYA